MHRGWGRCGDDIQERTPQMLPEALMGSALETGQKQQQRVSVILLISTLGVRTENGQRHSSAIGTSAYSDALVLPERPLQCQPPNEATSSQSPTLNAHIDRPRGPRRHNRTSHSLLIFKGWDSENMMTTDQPLALP